MGRWTSSDTSSASLVAYFRDGGRGIPAPAESTGGGEVRLSTGVTLAVGDLGRAERAVAARARMSRQIWFKPLIFLLCLVPFAWLLWDAVTDGLGAEPVEEITHRTGIWTLRLLLVTLAVTPARRLLGWLWPGRLRRMLGLFAFFYACLHLATYLVFEHFFDWMEIATDIVKRPYITAGFAGFVILLPLAATSTNAMVRRLGGARWRRLHQLVYLAASGGLLHYLWLVKADTRDPTLYAFGFLILMICRVFWQDGVSGQREAEAQQWAQRGAINR